MQVPLPVRGELGEGLLQIMKMSGRRDTNRLGFPTELSNNLHSENVFEKKKIAFFYENQCNSFCF